MTTTDSASSALEHAVIPEESHVPTPLPTPSYTPVKRNIPTPTPTPEPDPIPVLTYEPFVVTTLSIDDLDALLVGTGLEGHGETFAALESDYGVNAVFAISVAFLESGYGTSNLALKRNNYFGFRGQDGYLRFDDAQSCILYFGKLMNKERYHGKSIEEIAVVYCDEAWADLIREMLEQNITQLTEDILC